MESLSVMHVEQQKKSFSPWCKDLSVSSWCHLSQSNVLRAEHLLSGHKMGSTADRNFTVAVCSCFKFLDIKIMDQIFVAIFLPALLGNQMCTRTTKIRFRLVLVLSLKKPNKQLL